MPIVHITKGMSVLVSEEDLVRVSPWKWQASTNPDGKKTYAVRTDKNRKKIRMHRFILGIVDPKIQVDHINGDTLDNRRENLRICNNSRNQANRDKTRSKSTSRYKGVSFNKQTRKWFSRIQVNNKPIFLGLFDSEIDAAKAYNEAAIALFGNFSKLNKLLDTD